MTLTDTVSSIAHDAVHAADDLRKQAVELGRTAAHSEAVSSAAHSAKGLARQVADKAPGLVDKLPSAVTDLLPAKVKPSRSKRPLATIIALLAVGAIGAFILRSKRRAAAARSKTSVDKALDGQGSTPAADGDAASKRAGHIAAA